MTLYAGIDLHSNNSMISVIDDNDHLVWEQRLPNELPLILSHLGRYRSDLHGVVVESTYNWYWLVDGLMEAGYPVQLANTLAIQQYKGLKYTNDASDARYLAHLQRLGILREGYIYPAPQRAVRDLLRRRLLLVHQHTMLHQSLQSLIARHSSQRLSAAQIKRLKREELGAYFQYPESLLTAQLEYDQYQELSRVIKTVEREVAGHCQPSEDYELITSTPGIGPILGQTILLETGPIERFPAVGHYASYARCVPTGKWSNGKRKGEGNRKNGNRYLGMAFVQAAHYAAIHSPQIQRFYQRRKNKVHVMVAKKTVANKLAKACYYMLKRREPFAIERAFG